MVKKISRIFSLLLVCCMLFSVCACEEIAPPEGKVITVMPECFTRTTNREPRNGQKREWNDILP